MSYQSQLDDIGEFWGWMVICSVAGIFFLFIYASVYIVCESESMKAIGEIIRDEREAGYGKDYSYAPRYNIDGYTVTPGRFK